MDLSNEGPSILPDISTNTDEETGSSRENSVMFLAHDLANIELSSNFVIYKRAKTGRREHTSQLGTELNVHSPAAMNMQTNIEFGIANNIKGVTEQGKDEDGKEEVPSEELEVPKEEKEDKGSGEESSHSRDENIKINLRNHLIYISHCIKPDDLVQYLHCYSDEQKSDIFSEKSPIRASRMALEMLLHNVEGPGRFAALRDALDHSGGYPKIVNILDGEYDPEDKNFVRIVELFAPELIGYIKPSELLPHLVQKGVFTQVDVEEITSEEKNHGALRAACILLMYLPRRAVDWYISFLNVLIDCKLEDTAEMLDPDFFEVLMKERRKTEVRGIDTIKHCVTAKMNKPKIPSKPRCLQHAHRDDDDAGKSRSANASCVDDDDIEYTEFRKEELEYILGNEEERKKLEDSMIYIDAKILWPEKSQGENQRILLRSLSKNEYSDACWSRKRQIWKRSVRKIFQDLFGQVSRQKCIRSNVSKIKHVSKGHKKIYKKVVTSVSRPSSASENKEITGDDLEVYYPNDIQKISECLMASGRRILIMKGSIVDIGVDVIVNTTNKNLSFSTGMAETICERGGETIREACRNFLQRQSSIDEGETYVCDGGDLLAKYVIHVNSPVFQNGDKEETKLLKQSVGGVMLQASRRNARSIALPAIGCGLSGWHAKTAAPLIISAVRNFFLEEQDSSLRHVYLIDLYTQTVNRFNQALRETFKDDSTCVIEP